MNQWSLLRMTDEDILTLQELSAYLKIAEKTLYGYAQKGTIPGIKIGSAWRFRKADIDAWLEERRRLTETSRGSARKRGT
jgi:excisionase family DNA binding protein